MNNNYKAVEYFHKEYMNRGNKNNMMKNYFNLVSWAYNSALRGTPAPIKKSFKTALPSGLTGTKKHFIASDDNFLGLDSPDLNLKQDY